jgi:hypothetical protein
MATGLTCLVTIHGIGFQQPPNGQPGYADDLHQRLSRRLGPSVLGDDPGRRRSRPGEAGPIYVQSSWPPWTNQTEPGLKRLGFWDRAQPRTIDVTGAPLRQGEEAIAHIALVYSGLESRGPMAGSAVEASARAALSLGHYASLAGITRMLFLDTRAALSHRRPDGADGSNLQVRTDAVREEHMLPGVFRPAQGGGHAPSGLLATVRQLEDDVAAYVCRNDLRVRVRAFVRDALLRLAYREDVAQIVVHGHSQGTVVAFDVLRELPHSAAPTIRFFVTAGSPLRKYVDCFTWGTDVGTLSAPWMNFWDPRDPVADPLGPPAGWHPGTPVPEPTVKPGLFIATDPNTGKPSYVPLQDRKVDNVANSGGGGLQAHNYWDNDAEVIQPLAEILGEVARGAPAAVAAGTAAGTQETGKPAGS